MAGGLTRAAGDTARDPARPLVCIGFMGAGKSTAARSVARALGIPAVDVDEVLEQRVGKPISRIFAEDGESAFRAAEERLTLELLAAGGRRVLALGGGAVGSAAVREALRDHLVLWIDVDPQTAWARCERSDRPLASDRDVFELLHRRREPQYRELADVIVPAERARQAGEILTLLEPPPGRAKVLWAASASGEYPAYVGAGLLCAERFWPAAVRGRRFLVSDANVARRYAQLLAPVEAEITIVPGEGSKTVAHAEIIWSELARAAMTRADVVVALGGGVIGDLAGFCAATYQRGVRYVQVPTSLVAQVDAAYGGKTGVDLAEAKNYVGAYHQPAAVLADTETLRTLPSSERASGCAEVIKTALIAGGWLWEQVAAGADPAAPDVVVACVQTKLRIVARDERDDGLRQVLNLGHTVAHAIESVTGYARYRHGEAVALGLLAALRLSGEAELREQVRELLRSLGLPTELRGADPAAVVMATARDKKRRGDASVPFVLLEAPGSPRAGCHVANRDLVVAVEELAAGESAGSSPLVPGRLRRRARTR